MSTALDAHKEKGDAKQKKSGKAAAAKTTVPTEAHAEVAKDFVYISNRGSRSTEGGVRKVVYFKEGKVQCKAVCHHKDCIVEPRFGPIGTQGAKHAILCGEHADRTLHENVVHARCAHSGCKAKTSFGPIGLFGSKHAILCGKHADRTLHEIVVTARCTHPVCKAIPSFGPIGLYSAKHAILCGKHADRTSCTKSS